MHIQDILNEDFKSNSSVPSIRFNDLNTLQVRTLLRLADGEVDIESASDSEYDVMADLADMGLLDDEYNLNERGQKAVAIAKKLGGSAEVADARARQRKYDSMDADDASRTRTGGFGDDDNDYVGHPDGADEDGFDFESLVRRRP